MARKPAPFVPLAPGTAILLTTWECWASYETTIVRFSRIDAGKNAQYIVKLKNGTEAEYPVYKFRVVAAGK